MTIKVVKYAWNSITSGGSPPASSGQAGAAIAIFDHCLTDTLGWTKTVRGTNIATYQMNGGSGNMLYVDDTGTTTARVKGMEACAGTTVVDWVNPFPSEAQFAGGLYFNKSSTADAVARSWFFWGGPKFFHLVVSHNGSANHGMRFGDPLPICAIGPEVGNTHILASANAAPSTVQAAFFRGYGSYTWAVVGGNYMARALDGIGGSVQYSSNPDLLRARLATNELGSAGMDYPSIVDGGMGVSKFYLGEITVGPRAVVPGIYVPCHARPIAQGVSFVGAVGSAIEGKTLECVYGSSDGCILAETSDTWDTVA